MDETKSKRIHIVLVGGGHANVQVMKMLAQNMHEMIDARAVKICLFTPTIHAYYSGMLPGCISGLYTPEETRMDVKELSKWCGVNFMSALVTEIDPKQKIIKYKSFPENLVDYFYEGTKGMKSHNLFNNKEETMHYDIISIDVGSTTRGADIPGVKEHSVLTRPINKLLFSIQEFENSHPSFNTIPKVVVIGGGAAGVELCWAFKSRFSKKYGNANVTVVNTASSFLSENGSWVSTTITDVMKEKGVTVLSNLQLVKVENKKVYLSNGNSIDFDFLILATGAAPPPLLSHCGLELNESGFIKVSETLQSVSSPFVFASGDCASVVGHPYITKAGVYAVREGPVVARNIMELLKNNKDFSSPEKLKVSTLEKYIPQRGFLAILMTGDGKAISSYKGTCFRSSLVWSLKDWIDRGFMDKFNPAKMGKSPVKVNVQEKM